MRPLRLLLYLIVFAGGTSIVAQEIAPRYEKMLERKYDFPTIPPDSVEEWVRQDAAFYILDTRERPEYATSHLPQSIHVGYDQLQWEVIDTMDRDKPVVVYCSIGVRSQNVAKKMKEKGFENVKNLYGGAFLWADQFRPLEDSLGKQTDNIHGYNRFWGRWIEKAPVVYE
ncbi:MAG: rhodanese-like domain-containing protein [Bacteroidota bacterium]